MGVMIGLLLAVGFVISLFIYAAQAGAASRSHGSDVGSFTIREGKPVRTDSAFDAWTSGDLGRMLQAMTVRTNNIDRHFLLQSIVAQCYKSRRDTGMRSKCREVAVLHISEFPSIAPALKRDHGGALPRVTTFPQLATVFTEDGEFDKAVEVCELAMRYGLQDGTKSGFAGRIERIRKKQARIDPR